MNVLLVGKNKTDLLEHLPHSYLFLDDGDLIDRIKLPRRRKITRFDFQRHSLNPLKDITYLRACDFVSIIMAAFPAGENTLTRQNAAIALHEWLDTKPKKLSHFPRATKEDVGLMDAGLKVRRVLLSPVLNRVLDHPTNFSFDGIVLVRLPRRELGDFDAFVLGNLLISAYKGQICVPDFGFYGRSHHTALIRQNRLIAGLNYLDESPLKSDLLLMDEILAARCTEKDAETLAPHMGWHTQKTGYNNFILSLIK